MFCLSHYYLTLEKNLAQIKLSFLLPKDALCRAWLKFDQGFLRRMFLKLSENFHYLAIIWMNRLTDSKQTDRQIDIQMQNSWSEKQSWKPHLNLIKMHNLYRISYSFGIYFRGGINSSPYGYLGWRAEISLSQPVSRDILEQDNSRSKQLSHLAKICVSGLICTNRYMIHMFILNITQ